MNFEICFSARGIVARMTGWREADGGLTSRQLERHRLQQPFRSFCTTALIGALFGSGLVGQQAHAAGFDLIEQSARGLGHAFAGEASTAEDATTKYRGQV
jgi:hypothetical protein